MKPLILLILLSATALAVTAKRTPTAVTQPDGTTFSLVGFGDERYHFAETLSGHVVIRGSDRYWYYAELDATGRFTPGSLRVADTDDALKSPALMSTPKHLRESPSVVAERRRFFDVERTLNEGTLFKRLPSVARGKNAAMRILILCIQYPDMAATQTAVSFQDMVVDDSWNGGIGGMSAYYKEVSYNALSITADYRNWVTAAEPSSYYADSDPDTDTHVREMIREAVDAAEAGGVDFSQYDNDGDGEVDGLFIVHAGPGAEEGSQTQYVWSHSGSLGSSYYRTYDGTTINSYIIMPELYGSDHVEIGVFCHEYGHMLGLPDLYDTNGATNGDSEGLGNWCLMASGSWGGNGNSPERPAHMSAYCKALLGFTTPTTVTTSGALSIPRAETDAFAYKIWLDDNQADEYLLIENRQKVGFDLLLPGSGLLMYHVDKNLADIWAASNGINVKSSHLGVKLYEADGLEQLANGSNRGNGGDPYPGSSGNTALSGATTPNSLLWNTDPSGVAITGISPSAAVMTASATLPVYYGSAMQFYRMLDGYAYGNSTTSTGYGMVRCIPEYTGKLMGVRVFSYANLFSTVTAAAFTTFSGGVLSSQTGSSVSAASDPVTNFITLDFSPPIDVTAGVPVYVRIFFRRVSGGYAVPIDVRTPATGNSYYSTGGSSFSQLADYDIATRVVFRTTEGLPVQLTSFTARPGGTGVALEWTTASEINNFGFEVQKDTMRTMQIFSTIPESFIAGQGTTLVPHSYAYTDKHASPGTWVYRLKQIDLDGTVTLSDPVIVEYTTTGTDVGGRVPVAYAMDQNYPNPFNPGTIIPYELPEAADVRLSVFDVLGREVSLLVHEKKEAGVHAARFDASGLPSGGYFARISAGSFTRTIRLLLVR